jgi:hypothetical protein
VGGSVCEDGVLWLLVLLDGFSFDQIVLLPVPVPPEVGDWIELGYRYGALWCMAELVVVLNKITFVRRQ